MKPSFEQTISSVRFGCGLRPGDAAPDSPQAIMRGLRNFQPRPGREVADLETRSDLLRTQRKARNARKEKGGDMKMAEAILDDVRRDYVEIVVNDAQDSFATAVDSESGFFERLSAFWTDHFTVASDNRRLTLLVADMIRTAIRPNVTTSFPEMLSAVTKHPAMLVYLNQNRSVGPNSEIGQRRERGLNENLAREILELHTLGVGGGYGQKDVREFAELLTGLATSQRGFEFRPRMAEPGAERVLGRKYGDNGRAELADVEDALRDLALHPQTADHLATKLVVHFIGAPADPGLVRDMARAYREAGGRLNPMYRVMLEHESAWSLPLLKAKTPFDYVVSAFRAYGLTGRDIRQMKTDDFRKTVQLPVARMGQPFLQPAGPNGWPEEPEAWITPSNLAARVIWAHETAQRFARERDPRVFLDETLGPIASPQLASAVAGAETRFEGVAVVLASPEFNRR